MKEKKIFRVKIIKSSQSSYWYCNKIGETFRVYLWEEGDKYVCVDKLNPQYNISVCDAEILQDKNLLGYKCPSDFYGGKVKQGTIVTLSEDDQNEYEYAFDNENTYYFPKELVATWEPIYKPFEELITFNNGTTVKVSVFGLEAEGKNIEISSIRKLIQPSLSGISGWNVTLREAKFYIGCKQFSKEDLELIIKTYESINGTEPIKN